MAYWRNEPCIEKAFDDEMLFVLMGRDETAPLVVLEWIKLNIGKQPEYKLLEAFEAAMEMHRNQIVINDRKNYPKDKSNV